MTRPIDDLFGELSRPLGPTDWPEPAQLRRKAEHKRTVRRVTVASSVAVVAAFAVAVPATLAGHHSSTIDPAGAAGRSFPSVTSQPAPAASSSPVAKATAAPTPAGTHADSPAPGVAIHTPLPAGATAPSGIRHTYGSFSVVVPHDWVEASSPVPTRFSSPTNEVCIAPPVTPQQRSFDSCAGLEIWYGGFLPGAYGTSFEGNRETSPAWWHGTGDATCPGTATTPGPLATSAGGPSVWDYYRLGSGKVAVHNEWAVHCADGTTFHPQAWYLPKSHILFWSYLSDPAAQAILATLGSPAS